MIRPQWVLQYPKCSECDEELDYDYDTGWECPTCGARWNTDAVDGDECTGMPTGGRP